MSRRVRGVGIGGIVIVTSMGLVADLPTGAAELVRDINRGIDGYVAYGSNSGVELSSGTLLTLDDGLHGDEPWITDYTAEGTRLLRDLYPGRTGSASPFYVKLGDIAVFVAWDPEHGSELWRSDGTAAGTYLLADIGPGQQHGASTPVAHDGWLYFAGNDGVSGQELWRTDGTREGTHLVSDIVPGTAACEPTDFVSSSSHLFFICGSSPWVTDGTASGTHVIAGPNTRGAFFPLGGKVYFPGNDGVHGEELWRVDADGLNAQMVANLSTPSGGDPLDGGSYPIIAFARGTSLFFTAQIPLEPPDGGNASETVLYRTDTTGTGAVEIARLGVRSGLRRIINLPAGTLFDLDASGTGDPSEIWLTDGSAAGTQRLDLGGLEFSTTPDVNHFRVAYGANDEAYFFGRPPGNGQPDKIWRTDGTVAGTNVFADLSSSSRHQELTILGGRLYFDSGDGTGAGNELWTSDGSSAGTFQLRDLTPGAVSSFISHLRVVDGRLLFLAGPGAGDASLWTSNGTASGTVNLSRSLDITTNDTADANIVFAGMLGSRAVFAADQDPDDGGRELFITDGTRAGTDVVHEINTGGASDPGDFLTFGNELLFVARDFSNGRELWRTDGTDGGTVMLTDFQNTHSSDDGNVSLGASGSVINGIAYFTAGSSVANPELWSTDGTAAGTSKVPGSVGQRVAIIGGNGTNLLYTAHSTSAPLGPHLWSYDGATARILTVADSLKVFAGSGLTYEGRVCFRAWDVDPSKVDVWCSNGTPGDLARATNLAGLGASAGALHVIGNKLLVNGAGAAGVTGLYATSGLAATMQKISAARIEHAKPYDVTRLAFATESGGLWLTDGTAAGTRSLLQGLALPGTVLGDFGVLGDSVVFMVNDADKGAVVWRTNGTVDGSRYLADLDTGTEPATRNSSQFQASGDRLLFSAFKTGIGNELWSLSSTEPNASDDVATATGGVAKVVALLENDADFDGSLDVASVSITLQPLHGTAIVNATGVITYTADSAYSGTDVVGYRVRDDQGKASNQALITIQVTAGMTPPPTAPPATPPPTSSGGGGGGGGLGIELLCLLTLAVMNVAQFWRRRSAWSAQ